MTGNQFQQNFSVKLTGNFLVTFSTENFTTFSFNLTQFFNSNNIHCILELSNDFRSSYSVYIGHTSV